jgi:hypothetical protein
MSTTGARPAGSAAPDERSNGPEGFAYLLETDVIDDLLGSWATDDGRCVDAAYVGLRIPQVLLVRPTPLVVCRCIP